MRTIKIKADTCRQDYNYRECKQNDDIPLEITLLEGGVSLDLSGCALMLNWIKADNKIVTIAGDTIKVTGNIVRATLPRDCTRAVGQAKFELVITDNTSKQISTFPLSLEIIGSVLQGQQASDNVATLTEELNNANTAAINTKNEIKDVIETADLTTYASQGQVQEINSQLEENVQQNIQGTSLVEKMLGLIDVKCMYMTRDTANNGINVGICLQNESESVVEYRFRNNADGLLLLRGVVTGAQLASIPPIITLTGTYNQTSAPATYTTTVGDKFTFTFTGTKLTFKRVVETRGGLWRFKLDNGQSQDISCYSTIEGTKEIDVFNNLSYATYQCTATFMGVDPVNAPSTPPARGYLNYISTDLNNYTVKIENKLRTINTGSVRNLISPSSIPDFAISAKPVGTNYTLEWIPAHSVSGVSLLPSIKVIIDGITATSVSNALPTNDFLNIKKIEIFQAFNAVNPHGVGEIMWKHYISHTITVGKPYLEIKNRIEVQRDTNIGAMYLTMLPVDSTQVQRLVLNNGVEYDTIPNDGSEVSLGLDVSSAMYAGVQNAGYYHGCAIDVGSYSEATGINKYLGTYNPGLLTFRADNISKFYLNGRPQGTTLKAGEIYKNTQRISCVAGVRYPNELLKTI